MLKSLRLKIFKDLRLNRGQFLAVWMVVTLGTAFYGAMYPSGLNMLASFFKTYDTLNYLNFQAQFDPAPIKLADRAHSIEGVDGVEGRIVVDAGIQTNPESPYRITLRLISVPDAAEPTVNQSDIIKGTGINGDDEVLLLKSFADKQKISVGDVLHVYYEDRPLELRVAGLVMNPEYLVAGRSAKQPFPTPSTFGVAWMRYTPLSTITGLEDQINDIVIHLEGKSSDENLALENRVRRELTEAYGDLENLAVFSRLQTGSGSVVEALINGNFPIMIFFSGIFLLGSVVITSILLGRVVQSERRHIGTMRAMGITRRELVLHYLSFGLLIGISGGAVGTVLGYLNSFWVMDTFIKYIAGGTLPAFTNVPQVPFLTLGFSVAVVGCVLAGIYPAWVESATPPGIALRPAMPKTPSKLSRVAVPFLPLFVRQSLRNLLRTPGRAFSTALGVTLGAMMIFSTFAMWDSFNTSATDYFQSNAFDLRVDMAALQPGNSLESRISELEHVEAVQAALIGPIKVFDSDGEPFDTFAITVDETDPFFDFKLLDGERAYTSADAIWIGHNLRRITGLDTGDTMTFEALGQRQTVRIAGVVSQMVGAPVFLPRSLVTQWTPGGVFFSNSALVRTADGQAEAVRDALVDLPGMVAVEVFDDLEGDINTYLEFFRMGTIIFGGFGYVLTFAVLFNTVNASLRERQEELSILRALGQSLTEIALIVLIELILMTLLGALVGIPLGREVGYYLQESYNSNGYGAVTFMYARSYLVGFSSILVIVFLAMWTGLRSIRNVDLGTVSKSQSV